jgi:hypothetical protein
LTLVNVVDTSGWRDARAVAAGLLDAYSHVAALGPGTRRGGNVVVFGAATEPGYRQLEGLAAADGSPARLIPDTDLAGAAAWRDQPTTDPLDKRDGARQTSTRSPSKPEIRGDDPSSPI